MDSVRLQVNSRLLEVTFWGSYTRVFDCVGGWHPNSCLLPGTTVILLFAVGVQMGDSRYLVTAEGFVGVIFAGGGGGVGESGGPLDLERGTGFLWVL